MRAFYVLRSGRRRLHVVPLLALKCGAISLAIVITALFLLDRIVLPVLERKGLTAGDDWARHNAIVIAEHQRADRTIPFPEDPRHPVPAGVRSWLGDPVAVTKRPGTKRILVMGDSFVWGSPYLTLNHMWWRQLGQLLAGNSVEVIAIGRPGAATRDQLEWARYFVSACQPDLILWGYVTNDADEGLVRQIGKSQDSIPKLDRVRHAARRAWPRVMAKFDALRSNKLARMFTGPAYGYEYSEWELKLVEPGNLAAYAKTVRAVKEFLDETGIPGFMMTLPTFPSTTNFTPRLAPILEIWRDAGVATYDTLPAFVRQHGEMPASGTAMIQWGINPADGHPGPRTCRFLAEQAAQIVRRDFPQILGETSSSPTAGIINDWLPTQDPETCPRFIPGTNGWTMSYPRDEATCPTMPLGIPAPLLAFRLPTPMSSMTLVGPSLKSAQVWVTFLDPVEGYDDGIPHDLGARNGAEITWTIPAELASRPMSLIRFRATFSKANSELTWSFSSPAASGSAAQPERH
jgi:lysophospholipase L1-like esterase